MAAQNLPAKQESEIRYTIEGREIVLSPTLVRKYLVRGKGELTTGQEIALFMGICRARQMDPWAGDCYIIKYSQTDPATVTASIDFVRARARSQEDCEGWTCGVIVQDRDGKVRDSNGLVLEGEKILGGWCECQPKRWKVPQRLEVNLSGYLKKTSDGKITKFWSPENQPTMISKVAEMQNLRRIWPAALGKIYLNEEVGISDMGDGLNINMEPEGNAKTGTWEQQGEQEESILERFERLSHERDGIDETTDLKSFIGASAKATGKTEDELMAAACSDFPKFLEIYTRSLKKKKEREEMERKAAKAKKKESKTSAPPPVQVDPQTGEVTQGDNGGFVVCSKRAGDEMTRGFCKTNCQYFKAPEDCPDYMSDSI